MPDKHIVFMDNLSSLRGIDGLVRASRNWENEDFVEINFSRTRKYFPNYSTLLAALLEYYKDKKNIKFKISNIRGYGNRIRLVNPYKIDYINENQSIMDKVIKFTTPDEAFEITNRYIETLIDSLPCEEGVIDTLQWCIFEILDNVFEHSEASSGFVMMQLHPKTHRCVISVADAGRGIHKAMYAGRFSNAINLEKIRTADVAIAHALERGVTSKGKNNQGNGLHGLKASVEMNGGSLTIHSGRGVWAFRNGNESIHLLEQRALPNVENSHTTVVDWRLNCDRPVDISKAISSKYENRNILEKYEGDENYILIESKILERASGTRQQSEKLRIRIENYLNAGAQYIVIDMKGISIISSSFADELFGKLAVKMGLKEYKSKIFLNNANRTIKMLIELSTERRIEVGL